MTESIEWIYLTQDRNTAVSQQSRQLWANFNPSNLVTVWITRGKTETIHTLTALVWVNIIIIITIIIIIIIIYCNWVFTWWW
jgi:hypothetical protein